MAERPLLTAEWRNLLLLNFPVPHPMIERLAPPGADPDLYNGQAYISIVGFRFENTRLFGLSFPGHTSFPEINLRFYVRRQVGNETRRGVVFAREVAPRRAVAIIANRLYNENYLTCPMRSDIHISGPELSPGDTIAYSWKSLLPYRKGRGKGSPAGSKRADWNRLSARIAAPLALAAPGSLEAYFVENYWGYVRARDGRTREYQVTHSPWRVAHVNNVVWNCDVASTYDPPLAEFLTAQPTSAFIAEGSPIQLFRGRKL